MLEETFSAPVPRFAPPVLTRTSLLDGSIHRMIKDIPNVVIQTDAERDASLREMLADRPTTGDGVWLFGYGSLIWNPTIHFVESRVATVEGWQRSFCLSTPMGRGTPTQPGLVLALDEGGSCTGVAFRIDEHLVEDELSLIWRREMLTRAYVPRWVELRDIDGHVFDSGIAFTINHLAPNYTTGLSDDAVCQRLATASGQLGSSADYLFQTQHGLSLVGITDPLLDRMATTVSRIQAGGQQEERAIAAPPAERE